MICGSPKEEAFVQSGGGSGVYPSNAGCEAGIHRLFRVVELIPLLVCLWEPEETCMDCNPSSGLNQGPWSCEASGISTDAEHVGEKFLYGFMKQHLT